MANIRKPELLTPTGNFDKLCYALAYRADATYAGITKFFTSLAGKLIL
jgi:collagenase-like PrtC family protease